MSTFRMACCLLLTIATPTVSADPAPILIGINAEFGISGSTSAQAVRLGAQIAVAEINAAGGVLKNRTLALVERDDHAVPARSVKNLRELATDPHVVAVLCGKYSPVAVEVAPIAQELHMPFLDPWAAADAITTEPNHSYTFRLSLRDSWAMKVMVDHARARGVRKIGLLVPNTEWGRSSAKAIDVLDRANPEWMVVETQWYVWGEASLRDRYQAIKQSGAELMIFVTNDREGALLVKEVAGLPPADRLPILSHWGITGGAFFENAGAALKMLDFAVVQTYSFIGATDPIAQRVIAAAQRAGFDGARRIPSPVGVAHAYDLVHILAKAINSAGSIDRAAIRDALEQVTDHVGLVKTYAQPFTADRHDALSPQEVFMARYADDGAIVRIETTPHTP